jgi:macrolide transport system ATP-binding/permease protein
VTSFPGAWTLSRGAWNCAQPFLHRQEGGPVTGPDRKLAREFRVSSVDGGAASGGEKTRLKIAAVFDESAGILFADEPTANLDLEGIRLLEDKLAAFRGAMLLVSTTGSYWTACVL